MRNIIWDFDGTLFDTDSAIVSSFLSVLEERYGVLETERKIRSLVKIDTKYCAKLLSEEYGLEDKSLLSQAREAYDQLGIEAQQPFDGARACCEKVLEVGGVNVLITHRDKSSTEQFLKHYGFSDYFSCVLTSDDDFELKPSPQSFQHAIEALSLDKVVTCGVGDRKLDVGAANGAQIDSYFFCPEGTQCLSAKFNITNLLDLESRLA